MIKLHVSLYVFGILKPLIILTLFALGDVVGLIPLIVRTVGLVLTIYAMVQFINFAGIVDQMNPEI